MAATALPTTALTMWSQGLALLAFLLIVGGLVTVVRNARSAHRP